MPKEINYQLISITISAALSILTILSSAIFLIVNIKVNRKNTAREVQRQVFSNFYLPVKFKLSYINNIVKCYPEVDIFIRKSEDALYEKRRLEILVAYQNFTEWISKEQYCCSQDIDKLIFKVIEHMQFVIVFYNDEKSLRINKSKYPIPDFDNIIQKIDKEFEKGKFV